jgi:hypothetical protein
MNSLGKAAISGVRRAADRFLAARARWTSAKFGRPVAEGEHEAEAEHDRDPVGPDGVGDVADPGALPGMQGQRAERLGLGHLVLQPVPAADRLEPDDRERHQPGQDDEELQDLVVDGRRQAAQGDVDQHDRGGQHDGDWDRPAEQQPDDQGHGEQVDPGDQHGGHREAERVEHVGGVVEAQPQVLGDAADLGVVVERHHHDAQEHHGRHRADPVEVHRGDPVLGAVGGQPQDLQRAEVGGDERQPGDPGRQGAAGEEEVQPGVDLAPGRKPDPQHHREVDSKDPVVDRARVDTEHRAPPGIGCCRASAQPISTANEDRWRRGRSAAALRGGRR